MQNTNHQPGRHFRVHAADRTFELNVDGERILVNGQTRECSFVHVRDNRYSLILDGRSYPIVVEASGRGEVIVSIEGERIPIRIQNERDLLLERFGMAAGAADGVREVRAPMPGLVVRILVEEGRAVTAGAGLVVLEAMKMENELKASADGVVKRIHVAEGEAVGKNTLLVEFEV